jgi:hypothetical protein
MKGKERMRWRYTERRKSRRGQKREDREQKIQKRAKENRRKESSHDLKCVT